MDYWYGIQISGLEALSGIVCHGRVSHSHGLGRTHGRISAEMLGLASTAMGLWDIGTGLTGLGASVGAELISYGGASIAAIPVAAGSFALISKGVAEVGAGLAIWKNAETKIDNPFEGIKTTLGNLQKQVQQGKAPKTVERVDKGRGDYEKDHVHFEDGSALNIDGSWKHGGRKLTRQETEWLLNNGWKIPKG